jgi:predicted secreted protein
MGLVSGIVVYVITWWIVLFTVLPWGVTPQEEVAPGHEAGAPAQPKLLIKFAVTTVIATVLWLIIYLLVDANIFSFRDWAARMDH